MLLDLYPFQEAEVVIVVDPYRKRGVVVGGYTRKSPGGAAFDLCHPLGTTTYSSRSPGAADFDDCQGQPSTAYTKRRPS